MQKVKNSLLIYAYDECNVHHIDLDYSTGVRHNSANFYEFNYWKYFMEKGENETLKYVKKLIKEKEIDYVFVRIFSYTLSVEFFKKISEESILVMLFLDSAYYFDIYKNYAQVADYILEGDPMFVDSFRAMHMEVTNMITVDKAFYLKKTRSAETAIDVSFVGAAKEKRKEYIDFLITNGIRVKAFGKKFCGPVSFDEMVDIFNDSKINLSFGGFEIDVLRKKDRMVYCNNRQVKSRPLEIAMCGGFVLTEYMDGIENFFKIGEEIDVFETKEEMVEKIKFYLKEDSLRKTIAENGHRRALDYDCRNQLKKVFDKLENIKKKDKEILYFDKISSTDYFCHKFTYLIYFLYKMRFLAAYDQFIELLKNVKHVSLMLPLEMISANMKDVILSKFPKKTV